MFTYLLYIIASDLFNVPVMLSEPITNIPYLNWHDINIINIAAIVATIFPTTIVDISYLYCFLNNVLSTPHIGQI